MYSVELLRFSSHNYNALNVTVCFFSDVSVIPLKLLYFNRLSSVPNSLFFSFIQNIGVEWLALLLHILEAILRFSIVFLIHARKNALYATIVS
jgi:hypothetical protein